MGEQIRRHEVAELKFPGVKFSVTDYHWDAGAEIFDCGPNIRLRWRMRPYRVKATGWIKPGEERRFGQMMLHPADVATHASGGDEEEDVRTLECQFEQSWVERVTGSNLRWADGASASWLDLRNADLDYAVRRLVREILEPGFASLTLAESIGTSMAVDIVRLFEIPALDPDLSRDSLKGGFSPGRLRQVHEYVESLEDGYPTLVDIAGQCGVSVAHLRRMYKSTTGQTLHDYIERLRMTRAKALLLDTNLPLKLISYKLGFCHPSAFSFAFKKLAGESPRAFRHRCATGLTAAA